jgi:hypothetical protein
MIFGPLLNSTDSTSNFGLSSFYMIATPPWCPLTAFEHMIEYPEAVLGYLSLTSFVSISTANPTPICAKPVAACVNRPPLPSTIFQVAILKVPLPSSKEGAGVLSGASITLAQRQRPRTIPPAPVRSLIEWSDLHNPTILRRNGGGTHLLVV